MRSASISENYKIHEPTAAPLSHNGHLLRAHWSIENSLHWRLDVVFREDESRMRTGHSARVFTLFRRIALNFLNLERRTKRSVRAKRKQAARNPQDLLEVLTSV
jgi:predicted transposase YbfD/YdcC